MERYIRLLVLFIAMMFGIIPINLAQAESIPFEFHAPFPDGETYDGGGNGYYYGQSSGHSGTSKYCIDFNQGSGSDDENNLVTATAGGIIVADQDSDSEGYHTVYPDDVAILHEDGWYSLYMHLNSNSVSVGDEVRAGQEIGKIGGQTGYDPHLHFCIFNSSGQSVMPTPMDGTVYDDYGAGRDVTSNNREVTAAAVTAIKATEAVLYADNLIDHQTEDSHWYGGMTALTDSFILKDWDGGDWGWVAITFDPANVDQNRAYVIRHGFWIAYKPYGPDYFGAPLGDEMDRTRVEEYSAYDPYCTPKYGQDNPEACIEELCGPTDYFSSVQRFSDDEHGTLCWNTEMGSACEPDVDCPCYDVATTTAPSSGTSTSSTSTLDPATWWYSSLDMTSQGPVDGIDSAADIRGYVNPSTGTYRVTFTGGNGNIYTETSDGDGQSGTWGVMTLSAFAWVPYVRDGITTYPFYDSTTGDEEALFVGEDGNMWFMTIDGTTGSITSTNAAGYTGVPYANSSTDPTGYYDPFTGDLQLYFVGTDNHLRQLLRDGVTGSWSSYDFTSVFSGWTLYPGTHPTAFMDPVNGIHYVLFTETDRRIKLLMSSDTVTWSALDLTSLAPVDYTISTPVGFVHPITGAFYVYLMGQNQRVYEIWYNGSWYGNDLTAVASVPYGEYGTSVSAVVNILTGDTLVTFQGDNHRINQFRYRNNSWNATDLTSRASVEYARVGSTPYTFVDPFTGAETTLFAGSNHRIQLIRFGPAFSTTPVTTPPTTDPTHTDQYLFIDVDQNGTHDPCVREGSTLYCDQNLDGSHDWTFSIGSSNAEYFSNGTGATVIWPGGDTWYSDTNSDSVTNSTCAYGNGSNETQRLVWRNTIMVRWGSAIYLDRNLDGITDNQVNWGAGTETYHLADMNGDGNVDLLKQTGNRFYVNTNNDGFSDWSFTYGASNGSDDYYFADIDGDGADDILVRRCLTACNWFLVLYNSSISHSCPNCSHGNDDDFTYGHGL